MRPRIHGRDRVFALPRNVAGMPKRGDIVAFNKTGIYGFPDKVRIKRVVGLPGERLEIAGGRILINGEPFTSYGHIFPFRYSYGPVKVPAGQYFLLGDNTDHSIDSRLLGTIPLESIDSIALFIWRPFKHFRPLIGFRRALSLPFHFLAS